MGTYGYYLDKMTNLQKRRIQEKCDKRKTGTARYRFRRLHRKGEETMVALTLVILALVQCALVRGIFVSVIQSYVYISTPFL